MWARIQTSGAARLYSNGCVFKPQTSGVARFYSIVRGAMEVFNLFKSYCGAHSAAKKMDLFKRLASPSSMYSIDRGAQRREK